MRHRFIAIAPFLIALMPFSGCSDRESDNNVRTKDTLAIVRELKDKAYAMSEGQDLYLSQTVTGENDSISIGCVRYASCFPNIPNESIFDAFQEAWNEARLGEAIVPHSDTTSAKPYLESVLSKFCDEFGRRLIPYAEAGDTIPCSVASSDVSVEYILRFDGKSFYVDKPPPTSALTPREGRKSNGSTNQMGQAGQASLMKPTGANDVTDADD